MLIIQAIIVSIIGGIIFSIINKKKMIPFGPFITLGWLTISLFDSFFIM